MRHALQAVIAVLFAVLATPVSASLTHQAAIVEAAAERVDVDYVALITTAAIESRGNPKAKNPNSSAAGLFQFVDRTWRVYIKRYGSRYGFNHRTSKHNPRANALMAAHYMKDNERVLRRALKRQPVPGELYMAHLLGLGGALKVIKAPSHRTAAGLLPTSAAGNRKFFYTDKGKARTVRQFRDNMNWRFTTLGAQLEERFPRTEDNVVARI